MTIRTLTGSELYAIHIGGITADELVEPYWGQDDDAIALALTEAIQGEISELEYMRLYRFVANRLEEELDASA